jgi:hypothetical protein
MCLEAAAIFYSKNTFSFQGHHNYLPFISWLSTIGSSNRSRLANLQIDVIGMVSAGQDPDGSRKAIRTSQLMEFQSSQSALTAFDIRSSRFYQSCH